MHNERQEIHLCMVGIFQVRDQRLWRQESRRAQGLSAFRLQGSGVDIRRAGGEGRCPAFLSCVSRQREGG